METIPIPSGSSSIPYVGPTMFPLLTESVTQLVVQYHGWLLLGMAVALLLGVTILLCRCL